MSLLCSLQKHGNLKKFSVLADEFPFNMCQLCSIRDVLPKRRARANISSTEPHFTRITNGSKPILYEQVWYKKKLNLHIHACTHAYTCVCVDTDRWDEQICWGFFWVINIVGELLTRKFCYMHALWNYSITKVLERSVWDTCEFSRAYICSA